MYNINEANELLDAIEILVEKSAKNNAVIYSGIVTEISTSVCTMKINGNTYSNIVYYGGTPIVGNAYRVFVPFGNMSQAFTLIFADTSPGESGVQSVNGKTGDVVLTAVDVGALPSGTKIPNKTSGLINDSGYITESAVPTKTSELINDSGYVDITAAKNAAPVQSVNSKTGTVVIGKTDVGLGNVDNVKQYSISNPPPYPVTSVNGQTGDVTIEAGGNVDSVNGKTGVVVLTPNDIGINYKLTKNEDNSLNLVWSE